MTSPEMKEGKTVSEDDVERLACEICWSGFSVGYRVSNRGKEWDYWRSIDERSRTSYRKEAREKLSPTPKKERVTG